MFNSKHLFALVLFGPCWLAAAGASGVRDTQAIAPGASPLAGVIQSAKRGIRIPFTLIHDLPVVMLELNGGKPRPFLLDSGTQYTLLNADEAEGIKISEVPGQEMTFLGVGQTTHQRLVVAKGIRIKFEGQTLVRGSLPVLNLADFPSILGIRLAGIIGYDVLRANPAVIDYASRQFTIYPSKSFIVAESQNLSGLCVEANADLPVVSTTLNINGKELGEARTELDTGSENAVTVNLNFSSVHRLGEMKGWKQVQGAGFSGHFEQSHGLPGYVMVGTMKLDVPDINVITSTEGTSKSNQFDLILGSAAFKDGIIIFNVKAGRIYMINTSASRKISAVPMP